MHIREEKKTTEDAELIFKLEATPLPAKPPDPSFPAPTFTVDLGDVLSDFDDGFRREIEFDSFEEAREYVVESLQSLGEKLLNFAEEVCACESPEEISDQMGLSILIERSDDTDDEDPFESIDDDD